MAGKTVHRSIDHERVGASHSFPAGLSVRKSIMFKTPSLKSLFYIVLAASPSTSAYLGRRDAAFGETHRHPTFR